MNPFCRKDILFYRKLISAVLVVTFSLSMVVSPSGAQLLPNLPAPGQAIWLTAGFKPPVLRGMTVHPENPLLFDFIVDRGQDKINNDLLKIESTKLIKYFLASMTIPNKDAWVNLSPYEKDRIIPDALGQTEMGRQMLEQDYVLKQLSSLLTNPNKELGQKFWKEVKARAQKQFGTTDIPLNTFNKVWIMPDGATVVEKDGFAYITESKLKVMLDEDYQALNSQKAVGLDAGAPATAIAKLSTVVFREMILPKLVEEVNTGKNFAQTRQVYQSVILAAWYKKALKDSLLGRIYADKSKIEGVESDVKDIKQKVYEQYLDAFKKGAYNVIKEEDSLNGEYPIPRKYFSGGENFINPRVQYVSASSAVDDVLRTVAASSPTERIILTVAATEAAEQPVQAAGAEKAKRVSAASPSIELEEAGDIATILRRSARMADIKNAKGKDAKPDPIKAGSWNPAEHETMSGPVPMQFTAADISPLPFVESNIEPGIREEIARAFTLNLNQRSWMLASDLIEKHHLEQDVSRRLEEKINLAHDYFHNIRIVEWETLNAQQKQNRFLSNDHPIVRELQGYVNQMTDSGLPPVRLYIAVDGAEPSAFHVGHAIVINLALISRLDTIDEIVSVLGHETRHHEIMYETNQLDAPADLFNLGQFSAERIEEYLADQSTPSKLNKLGFKPMALFSALGKIVDTRSIQGTTHGDLSTRLLALIFNQSRIDVEAQGTHVTRRDNTPIPDGWRRASYPAGRTQPEVADEMYRDFESALRHLPLDLISDILVEVLLSLRPRQNEKKLRKIFALVKRMESDVTEEGQRRNWTPQQMDKVLFGLMMSGSGPRGADTWVTIYGLAREINTGPEEILKLKDKLKAMALHFQSALLADETFQIDGKSEIKVLGERSIPESAASWGVQMVISYPNDFVQESVGSAKEYFDRIAPYLSILGKSFPDESRKPFQQALFFGWAYFIGQHGNTAEVFTNQAVPFFRDLLAAFPAELYEEDFNLYMQPVLRKIANQLSDFKLKTDGGNLIEFFANSFELPASQIRNLLFGVTTTDIYERFAMLAQDRDEDALIALING